MPRKEEIELIIFVYLYDYYFCGAIERRVMVILGAYFLCIQRGRVWFHLCVSSVCSMNCFAWYDGFGVDGVYMELPLFLVCDPVGDP